MNHKSVNLSIFLSATVGRHLFPLDSHGSIEKTGSSCITATAVCQSLNGKPAFFGSFEASS
jgi:hypothetical protein